MKEKSEEKKIRKLPPENLEVNTEEPSVTDSWDKHAQPATISKLEQEEVYLVELEPPNSIQPPPKKNLASKPPKKSTAPLKKSNLKPSIKKSQTKKLSKKHTSPSTFDQPTDIKPLTNQADSKDLKELFIYLDELLSHLPEEKINQFAHSKYYKKYMSILKKLKI